MDVIYNKINIFPLPYRKDRWLDLSWLGGLEEHFRDENFKYNFLYDGNLYQINIGIENQNGMQYIETFYCDNGTFLFIQNQNRYNCINNVNLIYIHGLGGSGRYEIPRLCYINIEKVTENFQD